MNTNKPRALMLASVASMIDLFNADNINILLDMGYDVDVVANFENGSITSQDRVDQYRQELTERGIRVYNIPIPRSLTKASDIRKSLVMVKQLVECNQYKIVHCHSPIGGVICRLACRDVRKKYGTKVIYTAHGFHFFKGASKKAWILFYPVEKYCSRYTDLLITINKEDYESAKKFNTCKVEYVPGIGVHTEELRNLVVDRRAIRKEFGFGDDDFVIMSTGQISVRKNHEAIIRALPMVNNPKVKYLIVGFGEEEEHLRKLCKELGIDKQVVFAGYRRDVKKILHTVDAYAFPSLQEGLPVSLMEAMAVGLPIVCSKIRGNVDLIEENQGGYLYAPYDYKGFSEGIKKIAEKTNPNMGKINIETMKKFDIEIVNKFMEKIYVLE